MTAIAGLIVPIITPLTEDQQVDEPSLANLCDLQIQAGVNVIFALGTTGEFYGLTLEQRQRVVGILLETAAGRVPVIVNISGESTTASLAIYNACRRDAVAGYVANAPYFYDYTQDELADHFRALADRIGQPLILYSYPSRYRHRLDIPTIASLVRAGLVRSIKDTGGDFDYLRRLLEIRKSFPNFGVFESHLPNLGRSAPLGIDGSVQALGNLFPGEFAAVWKDIQQRQWESAGSKVARLWEFQAAMQRIANFMTALKCCMSQRGWCRPIPAAPTRPASDMQRSQLIDLLKNSGT